MVLPMTARFEVQVLETKRNKISIVVNGGIGILEFQKSPNAIDLVSAEFLFRWSEQAEMFIKTYGLSAIVLRSCVEKVFVSGGDLDELTRMTLLQGDQLTKCMRYFCAALSRLSVPTFSLLNGVAAGGGAEIALATDYRWSTHTSACLWFAQARWGVPGGWHGMERLQNLAPSLDARRVGLLFAAQQRMPLHKLVTLDLVTSAFDSCDSALAALKELVLVLRVCPRDLMSDLLARRDGPNLNASDERLFEKYWLQQEHRRRLRERKIL